MAAMASAQARPPMREAAREIAPRDRLIVGLDLPSVEAAEAMIKRLGETVTFYKIGMELTYAGGLALAERLVGGGKGVFIDLKLHDIPNTVAKAIMALRGLDPAILTVHAAGGRAMLEDAKAAAPLGTKVVAVTTLTSLDGNDLKAIGCAHNAHDQVLRLTELAKEAGVDGVVCSGEEVGAAHKLWPKGFFVVPGVRLAGGAVGDQKRVVTPRAAIDAGASILIVGRPITQAQNPDAAAREIEATL